MGDEIEPFRQGALDSLCGIYAAINAMRWATRDDAIEDEFWTEVFHSLVLCTEVQVGIADVLVTGIGRKPYFRILRQVVADVGFRFGRKFAVRYAFGDTPQLSPKCFREHLGWFVEQPHLALLVIVKGQPNHWSTLIDISGDSLVLFDSDGTRRAVKTEGGDTAASRLAAKSTILISRQN